MSPDGSPVTSPARSPARSMAAALLVVVGGFQAGLAAGRPWGVASYGGSHTGVLPTRLRVVSGVAVPVYAALAVVVARRPFADPVQRRVETGLCGLFGLATVLNGASPSRPERLLWTPAAATLAAALWRCRDESPAATHLR